MSNSQLEHDEANSFALELLMPEVQFRDKIEQGVTGVGELAGHFEVPSMAVRYRAKMLNISGHNLRDGMSKDKQKP